jgi:hypothetical protein
LWAAIAPGTGGAAPPQREPSDDELHSMYCVEVLRAEIVLQQHLVSESSEAAGTAEPAQRALWIDTGAELLQRLERLEGALYQLQLYMLPRIPAVNPLALAGAIRQADVDVQESREDFGHLQFQQTVADASSWSGVALLGRVRACENPSWLR